MNNCLSLLKPNNEDSPVDALQKETLYRLSLDKIFSHFCTDARESMVFAETICRLPRSGDAILYRQAILADFLARPELFSALYEHFVKISRYQAEYEHEQREIYRSLRISSQEKSFSRAVNLVSMSALTLKRLLLLIKSINNLFVDYAFSSEGLHNLQSSIQRICGKDINALIALCSKFECYTTIGHLDFRLMLDASGRISRCDLISHNYIQADFSAPKKKKLFFQKQAAEKPIGAVMQPQGGKSHEEMYIFAITDLAKRIGEISTCLFNQYKSLEKELLFYKVALKYCAWLQSLGGPSCIPEVVPDGSFSCHQAYDLLLLLNTSPASVVPYSVTIPGDAKGTILFGDNSSGKTTFLRTIGVTQIFAQTGLPVPAKQVFFTPCSLILTYYAEAEKAGKDAGRFEQEVREFRSMFDSLVPGALVLLNAPFQSTSYDEGAKGLSDILEYFSALNIRWVLVTHMHQIQKYILNQNVLRLHTTKAYGINKVND